MTPEVETYFKENQGPCGCGCKEYGTLKKPWSNGQRCVTRKCKCPRCMGKNNRRKGDAAARRSRKALKLSGPNTRHEEHLRGPILTEQKAGKQVGPIWTRFQAARAQAEASRAIGDHRPFVMVAHPDGTSEWLLVVSSRDWQNVVTAYAQELTP